MFRSLRLLTCGDWASQCAFVSHQTPKEEKRGKTWQGESKILVSLNPLERMGRLKSCEEKADINVTIN